MFHFNALAIFLLPISRWFGLLLTAIPIAPQRVKHFVVQMILEKDVGRKFGTDHVGWPVEFPSPARVRGNRLLASYKKRVFRQVSASVSDFESSACPADIA